MSRAIPYEKSVLYLMDRMSMNKKFLHRKDTPIDLDWELFSN